MAWLVGYSRLFVPRYVGESYLEDEVPYVQYRMLSVIFGTSTIVVVFEIMRLTHHSPAACFMTACLLVFDNAHVLISRVMMLDSFLLFAIFSSYLCYFKFMGCRRHPFGIMWYIWLMMTGFFLSCAVSTKYVGLFTYATIGFAVTLDLWRLFFGSEHRTVVPGGSGRFNSHVAARLLMLIMLPSAVYLFSFWLHFSILSSPGPGSSLMSRSFQKTLTHSISGESFHVENMSFLAKFLELQQAIFRENNDILGAHRAASTPSEWPLFSRAVFFWKGEGTDEEIYFQGNPITWGFTCLMVAAYVFTRVSFQVGWLFGAKTFVSGQ